MTFRDLLDEINLYGGVNAVYGIVYQVTWGQPESDQITYVGSKCLKGKWQEYRTSSKAARQLWDTREPDIITIQYVVKRQPDITNMTMMNILRCRENEAILFASMMLKRNQQILNVCDARGGQLSAVFSIRK